MPKALCLISLTAPTRNGLPPKKKMKEEIVSKEEILKAKEFKIGNMYLSLESSDAYADFYSFPELFGLKAKTPEEKAKKVQSVTSKDIEKWAKKIFVNNTLNLAIVGPYKDEKEFLDILKI